MSAPLSWTNDRVAILTDLWRAGLSASAIARRLGGVTRNAVIGMVHRLGLDGRGRPARPGSQRPRPAKPARARAPRVAVARVLPVRVEPQPLAGTTDVRSVGAHACRWPIGDPLAADFMLCGRPAVRGAYCAPHGARAYRPPPRDDLAQLAGLR